MVEEELRAYNAELGLCPQCGGDRKVCEDPDREWFAQFTVCEVTMAREGAVALYGQLHEEMPYHDGWRTSWSKTRTRSHPFHWSDGLAVGVSSTDTDPDGEWLPVVAEEGAGNEDGAERE